MINLILLGPPGSGKSSTGNSILGRSDLIVSTETNVEDKLPFVKKIHPKGILSIIDNFDVMECGETACFKEIVEDLKENEGLSAFLFVVKYGQRFTDNHIKIVEMTKNIFGEDVFKNFGICILTGGDHYKSENKGSNTVNAKDWFGRQSGMLKQLYEECNKRCVLFDNIKDNVKEKEEQIARLMEMVHKISRGNGSYKFVDFEEARPQREKVRMEKKLMKMKPKFENIIRDSELEVAKAEKNNDMKGLSSQKERLEVSLEDFKKNYDTNSKLADEIKVDFENTILKIKSSIKSLQLDYNSSQQNRVDNPDTNYGNRLSAQKTNKRSTRVHDYDTMQSPTKRLEQTGVSSGVKKNKHEERIEVQMECLERALMTVYENFLEIEDPNTIEYNDVNAKLEFLIIKRQKLGN